MTDKDTSEREQSGPNHSESFAELFKETPARGRSFEPGWKIEAKIVGASDQYFFLDVGGKSEGCIAKSEFVDPEGNLLVAIGDTIKVYFLSADQGEMLFTSRLGGGSAATAHLEAAFEKRIPVEGLVEKEIKGGFEIRVSGNARAFCPYSQMGLRRIEEPAALIGQRLAFRIIEFSEDGRNIIVSHRDLLEEERQAQKEKLKESLAPGMAVKGLISSIRDFGAFVDIGGIDGLIPISEIGWGRVDDINEFLVLGQEVEAVVLNLDWEKERITLSLKQLLADPWTNVEEKLPVGSIHSGTVARLTPFGAFITLAPGIDGLLHISKLGAGRRINHPREVLGENQQVEVKIESIDLAKKRIALALASGGEEQQALPEEEYADYMPKQSAGATKPLGTLGDILQKQLKKKGK